MRSRPLFALAIGLACLPLLARAAHAKPKVAILGLEVTGQGATDEKTIEAAKQITKELRREANRPTGVFEMAPNSQKDLLEIKMLSDCSDEGRRCMSEIGQQLGAQRLIYGKLERRKTGYEVSLKLLNIETRDLEEQVSETFTFDEATDSSALAKRARNTYAKLSGAPADGSLDITANAERGTVYVDGQIKTSLSAGSARVSALSAGSHTIAIEAEGFTKFETEVTIAGGATETLRADLIELEGGGGGGDLQDDRKRGNGWRMAFWTGMVASGVGAAAFTFSVIKLKGAQQDKCELIGGGDSLLLIYSCDESSPSYNADGMAPALDGNDKCDAVDGIESDRQDVQDLQSACDRGKKWSRMTWFTGVPTAAAMVFTAVAGYMAFMRDGGSGPERDDSASRRKRARRRSSVQVTPSIGPDLMGAGLEITF